MYYNIKIIDYLKYHNQIALEFHICLQTSVSSLNASQKHNQLFTLTVILFILKRFVMCLPRRHRYIYCVNECYYHKQSTLKSPQQITDE